MPFQTLAHTCRGPKCSREHSQRVVKQFINLFHVFKIVCKRSGGVFCIFSNIEFVISRQVSQNSVKLLEFECFLVKFSVFSLTRARKVFQSLVFGSEYHFTNFGSAESQRITFLQIVLSKFQIHLENLNYSKVVL